MTFTLLLIMKFMNVIMESVFLEQIDVMEWMIVAIAVMKELRTVVR